MKKLYKIKVLEGGPKSYKVAIETYLIAENDEVVYNYIDKKLYSDMWSDKEKDDNTFKDTILKNKGDLDDGNWDDAFYGITKFGWEEVEIKHNCKQEYLDWMVDLKIATEV